MEKPNLFIIFMYNPAWPKITAKLLYNQHASDHPDLIARVFNMKLQVLINNIIKNHIFRTVVAYIHVVEFQKHSLPHIYILIILIPDDKPKIVDDYDNIMSAKISDKDIHSNTYNTVSQMMMHSSCSLAYPKAPYIKDGICSKNYS
ncbi:13304_t:CDS:1, partial [Racocetra persica]